MRYNITVSSEASVSNVRLKFIYYGEMGGISFLLTIQHVFCKGRAKWMSHIFWSGASDEYNLLKSYWIQLYWLCKIMSHFCWFHTIECFIYVRRNVMSNLVLIWSLKTGLHNWKYKDFSELIAIWLVDVIHLCCIYN